jgi:hypothetical protein
LAVLVNACSFSRVPSRAFQEPAKGLGRVLKFMEFSQLILPFQMCFPAFFRPLRSGSYGKGEFGVKFYHSLTHTVKNNQ